MSLAGWRCGLVRRQAKISQKSTLSRTFPICVLLHWRYPKQSLYWPWGGGAVREPSARSGVQLYQATGRCRSDRLRSSLWQNARALEPPAQCRRESGGVWDSAGGGRMTAVSRGGGHQELRPRLEAPALLDFAEVQVLSAEGQSFRTPRTLKIPIPS